MGLGWLESEGDKAGESAGLTLKFPKVTQMIHPLSMGLNMPVEHGARAAAAHRVPRWMNVEPFRCGFFAPADFVANGRIKNLCATACDRAETSGAQSLQCVT